MKQYHKHLEDILKYGTRKEPAREGMPGSISLFGYQNRYNLHEGFPILTTKKINFKNIVVELLWFLRGDTNIKYLVDNGCNIWNEDAYNYYLKLCKQHNSLPLEFNQFVQLVKDNKLDSSLENYQFGDCGKQYGWLWRNWEKTISVEFEGDNFIDRSRGIKETLYSTRTVKIDQIKDLIQGLKSNPMSRRHIITAWNPATLDDMALNACHAFVQFNCRPLSKEDIAHYQANDFIDRAVKGEISSDVTLYDPTNGPRYYLDCQLYQRSADMFLGVPYNISSYALLTEIIAKICNMIPGEFIHTFGDSHIYDNHMDQVREILSRDTKKYPLPKLKFSNWFNNSVEEKHFDIDLQNWIESIKINDFELEGYKSYSTIKAKLSTGLK